MNVQEHTTLRAVILPSGYQLPEDAPTNRLLMDLGHTVLSASTADQAMQILRDDPTDILIIDVTDSPENRRLIDRLGDLPAVSRPRELATRPDMRIARPSTQGMGQKPRYQAQSRP